MTAYRLSAAADADFESIARYTRQQWGADQARKYGLALIACFERLANGAAQVRRMAWGGRFFLRYRCQHHVILAREAPGELQIIAILHERMDIQAHIARRLQDDQP